jgi:hypothetical protein
VRASTLRFLRFSTVVNTEVITAVEVTAGNVVDGVVATQLLDDVLHPSEPIVDCTVYGDASYGTAEVVETLENAGIEANVKVQAPSSREGMHSQERCVCYAVYWPRAAFKSATERW